MMNERHRNAETQKEHLKLKLNGQPQVLLLKCSFLSAIS